jgi:5'-deoxynucleotidase
MYKFFAFLSRMKYINRWSLMRSTVTENVSEHSHQTAVVAHALAVVENTIFGGNIDANSVAVKAIFHESSEVITGDLPTPIKYFNPEIKTAYKNLEHIAVDKLLAHLPDALVSVYTDILSDNSSEEYVFVKQADKICAYIKCVEEIMQGNREFLKAKQSLYADIAANANRAARYFMDNFVASFELSLDELD